MARFGIGAPLKILALLIGLALAQSGTHKPGQGAEGPQARVLPPPALVAPPSLDGHVPGDRQLAARELADAEVLDALAIRAVRAAEQGMDERAGCAQLRAGHRGAAMAWAEAQLRVQTSAALLQHADEGGALAERHASVSGRLAGLEPRLDRLGRRLGRACPDDEPAVPRLLLPAEARTATDGGVAIFIDASAPSLVIWVDGRPRAATGRDGWAVIVTESGARQLCVAPPEEARCGPPSEVYAVMGSAFELRP